MSNVSAWSGTAGSNNSAVPDGAPEGWFPPQVNDWGREVMAAVARWYKDTNSTLTSGGSANAQTLTTNQTAAAYAAGQVYVFKAGYSNTGAATLNVDALGTKNIYKPTSAGPAALAGGEIIANSIYAVVYDGTQFQLVWGAVLSSSLSTYGSPVSNFALSAAVGSNALTITLLDAAGSTPSAASPVNLNFRNVTAATGTPTNAQVTAANTLVISSTSTMGTANSVAFKLWIVAFNDGGTIRLGAINTLSGTAPSLNVFPLAQFGIASSTAEGGAGAADSAHVFYTGTAVTSKAYVVLGYMAWESGLTTAGTWDAVPTRIQLFGPGVPLPGAVIQNLRSQSSSVATGTTVLPNDDTIPQNTEGDQYLSQAITPSSTSNLLRIFCNVWGGCTVNGAHAMALFQDTTAGALAAVWGATANVAGTQSVAWILGHLMRAGTTSATTMKIRIGPATAGTVTFNGAGGGRAFGGVGSSYLEIQEIMT